MTRACHWYNLLPVNHQRISGCKRQAVVQMRCCTEDLPSGHAEQGIPFLAHAMDQFTEQGGKAQGLSYASTLGQNRRE